MTNPPPSDPAARALFEAIDGRWHGERPDDVLKEIERHWSEIKARPHCIEDAETCRQARLAAVRCKRWSDVAVWQTRALARMITTRWMTGAASILMTDLHRALAADNDGYRAGTTLDVLDRSPAAEAIVHELEPFTRSRTDAVQPDFGPDAPLIARFHAEKRATLLLIAGHHEDAVTAYEQALEIAGDEGRGVRKVRGGLLLARYMRALDVGAPTVELADATADLAELADQDADIRDWAAANAAEMRRGGRALHVYDQL